jgi:radical SAM superfamily enzyme YgiQ (UPF0313 family)
MDILLAHGYFLALDEAEQRVMRPHPPLGLLYLSSHLKSKGIDAGVFDATFRTLAEFSDVLARVHPPIVGIAVNLMTKRNALEMIAIAKKHGARVVLGGPDPPYHAQSYLDAGADVVVVGEGEQTLEELVAAFANASASQADLTHVNGIAFKAADGGVVRTPPRALLPDLDRQPRPDRDAIDLDA